MRFLLVISVCSMCLAILINDSNCIEGKFTKNSDSYQIVFPARVFSEGDLLKDKKIDQRYKRSEVHKKPIHYRMNIGGNNEYIDLKPNSKIISAGSVVEIRRNDHSIPDELSNIEFRPFQEEQCIYSGKVRNYEDSSIGLSTCNGLFGLIRIKRQTYFIEPVNENFEKVSGHPHILHQLTSKNSVKGSCATKEAISSLKEEGIERHFNGSQQDLRIVQKTDSLKSHDFSKPLYLKSLLVLDKAMMNLHTSDDLENYVLSIMNMAQSVFNDLHLERPIQLEVVRIIQLQNEENEINCRKKRSAEEDLLNFSTWQKLINPASKEHPNHHDIAILLTGDDICDGNKCDFLGIAECSGICKPEEQAAICKDNGLLLGYTLTHEIGHVLGMKHDSERSGMHSPTQNEDFSSVMSPVISLNSREWSEASRESITSSLERRYLSCLEDEPFLSSIQHENGILPGFMYGADNQCKNLFSSNATNCEVSGDCRSLKCRFEETSCSNTGVMPLSGTPCGQNKRCYDGECLETGKQPQAIQGEWSAWSEWSPCSRTCGAGVSTTTRECNNPPPSHGGKSCVGQDKRHRICSSEPCPVGSPSFRDVQCSVYNDWIFPADGKTHSWKGFFITNENPCSLYCKNEENNIVSLAPKVIDGTTCYRGIRDISVNGVCQNIACDQRFDSNSIEDACGVCHGNGTTCKVVQKFKNITGQGETKILDSIPEGSRNIKVEAMKPNNSHFIVKSERTLEVFNKGNKLGMFEVHGDLAWLGIKRPEQEILEIPGPTSEPISIWLSHTEPQIVTYTMGLPSEPREGQYSWDYIDWYPCQAQCGESIQEEGPKCIEKLSGLVEDKYCNDLEKPPVKRRSCYAGPCYARWFIGEWQECGPCPSNEAKRFRKVQCVKPVSGSEDGVEEVSANVCPRKRPASSERCQCLKRQIGYWPPKYKPHFSYNEYRRSPFLMKTNEHLGIRKTRSAKTPEKKVTLMQLENESEESMQKQFQENLHKHNSLIYTPNIFGCKWNFTIPLKKRRTPVNSISPLESLSYDHFQSIKDYKGNTRGLEKLEKYFKELSYPPSVDYMTQRNVDDYQKKINFDYLNTLKRKYINKFFKAHVLDESNPPPLTFSDQPVLKLLSDNLPLQKLQQLQQVRYRDKPNFSKAPYNEIEPNVDNSNDFNNYFNLITLYNTLKMQSYLKSLFNNSQNDRNKYSSNKIMNKKLHNQLMSKLANTPTKIPKANPSSKSGIHLNLFNASNNNEKLPDSHKEQLNVLKLSNLTHFDQNEIHSQQEMNPDILKSGLKFDDEGSLQNNNLFKVKQGDKQSFNNNDLVASSQRMSDFEEPMFISLVGRERSNSKYKPETDNFQTINENNDDDFHPITRGNQEHVLLNKIYNKLRDLSHEDQIRIFNDFINIMTLLSELLSETDHLTLKEFNVDRTNNLFDQPFTSHAMNYPKSNFTQINQIADDKDLFHSSSGLSNNVPLNLNEVHDNEKIYEVNNLINKINKLYTQLCNMDSIQLYTNPVLKQKRKFGFPENSEISKTSNEFIKTPNHINSKLQENCPNRIRRQCKENNNNLCENDNKLINKDCNEELVGPLTYIYPIPVGRECTSSSTMASFDLTQNRCIRKACKNGFSSLLLNVGKNSIAPVKFQNCSQKSSSHQDKDNPLQISEQKSKIQNHINTRKKHSCSEDNDYSMDSNESSTNFDLCNITNDIFFSPPTYDSHKEFKQVLVMSPQNSRLGELQKELQIARRRICTGCYYLYIDGTTEMPKAYKKTCN